MLTALGGLGVALQAEPQRRQHPGDRPVRDWMPHCGQRPRQVARRLGRPHQQRHRIPTRLWVHQRLQPCEQSRVGLGQLLTAATRAPHPNSRPRIARKLPDPTGNRVRMRPSGLRDRLDPTRPSSAASEPNMRRRCRSSKCGRSTAYLCPTDSVTRTLSAIAQQYDPQSGKPRLFRRVSLGWPTIAATASWRLGGTDAVDGRASSGAKRMVESG